MYWVLFVFKFMLSCTPSPWRAGVRGAGRIMVLWGPSASHRVSPALGPQILPQEEDYGFDIEEKNKAVVVKSVQRGSLAEVRPPGGPPAVSVVLPCWWSCGHTQARAGSPARSRGSRE